MAKIAFEYEGKQYKLEYTADSLAKMEDEGVVFSSLVDKPISAPEVVFRGALLNNHPEITKDKAREIFYSLKRNADGVDSEEDGLMKTLMEMFTAAVNEAQQRGKNGKTAWVVVR